MVYELAEDYGRGIPVKIRLLEFDGTDISKFKIPVKGTKLYTEDD